MKVLVVDDEAPARARLGRMLQELDGCSVCAEAANGHEALAAVQTSLPDVILMDIRMPGMDGLEAAQHLQSLEHPPAIVFTTAYDDYALRAFEIHAVDYLLKPVRRERLVEALRHARRLTHAQASQLPTGNAHPAPRRRICARMRGGLQLIPVDEIRYFQADQKYVTVATADCRVLIEETLKALEDEFTQQFVRIHRNALIARRYLEGLEKDANGHIRARLRGIDQTLEISRRHLGDIRRLARSMHD